MLRNYIIQRTKEKKIRQKKTELISNFIWYSVTSKQRKCISVSTVTEYYSDSHLSDENHPI